jgi:hypothetical protein
VTAYHNVVGGIAACDNGDGFLFNMIRRYPGGDSIMTTAKEFQAILIEARAAAAELEATDLANARFLAAQAALLEARPTDPAHMAAQLRWLISYFIAEDAAVVVLEHVAAQLEAMAGGGHE